MIYNMTNEAQEHTRPGDGRHYTVFFNELLMDYFYPTNELSLYELTVRSRYQGTSQFNPNLHGCVLLYKF